MPPFVAVAAGTAGTAAQSGGSNVILVTIDGLRWQEFFGGAEAATTSSVPAAERRAPGEARFQRDDAGEGREAMMPFVWTTIAARGPDLRRPDRQQPGDMTNGLRFSYPGYHEMLGGVADGRIDTNGKVPNPNVTVLEWLNARPGFEGRMAAYGSWDVLPSILNADRWSLPVVTGWHRVPQPTPAASGRRMLAGELPHYWEYGPSTP